MYPQGINELFLLFLLLSYMQNVRIPSHPKSEKYWFTTVVNKQMNPLNQQAELC